MNCADCVAVVVREESAKKLDMDHSQDSLLFARFVAILILKARYLLLLWAKNEPKRAKFWLGFGSFLVLKTSQAKPVQITELEQAEPKSYQKFPSASEPSRILFWNFRARASRAGLARPGSSQISSRAVARSTSRSDWCWWVHWIFNNYG